MRYVALLFFLFLLLGCSRDDSRTVVPIDIIIDDAGILTAHGDVFKQYQAYNERLLEDFDIDFRVVTTTSTEEINPFTNQAFSVLEHNSRSSSGKAVLLVINSNLDQVRLAVSMALEPVYTDFFISYVERKGLVPYFRDNKLADGVYMMTELVRDRAVEARAGEEFMEPMETRSIGGGARVEAMIGQIDATAKEGVDIFAETTDTPLDILGKYLITLKTGNKNPNLGIFSEATRTFFQTWTVTDINMTNELRFFSQCYDGKVIVSEDDSHAVLLSPIVQRTCSPYFFVKEEAKWRLDIATMAKVLRFNTEMNWHFSPQDRVVYGIPCEFAFGGFYYDKNGYPYIQKNKYRWGFQCSQAPESQGQQGNVQCLISWLSETGSAKTGLGLKLNDVIVDIGNEKFHISNPPVDKVLWYLKEIPQGELAVVTVMRNDGYRLQLQAIAP
ncbi:MAG: hypothetical protein ACI8ZB_005022 [Desulforhopalus sp.]|jgi:uncharacterized protein